MPSYNEYTTLMHSLDTLISFLAVPALLGVMLLPRIPMWRQLPLLSIPLPPLWLILAAALIYRLPLLFGSFWYDETFTGAVVSLRFEDLHRMIMSDVHPPLVYFLQWAWVQVAADSEIALRVPSLGFGLLSIYLLYKITINLGGDSRVATLAAGLLAIMPVHVWYSTEARGYTLMLYFVWVMVLSILQNRSHWFLAAGLLGFIHAQGFIYLGILGMGAILYHRSLRWFLVVGFAGLIASLWLPFAWVQSQDVVNGFWLMPPSVGNVTTTYLANITVGQRLSPLVLPLVFVMLFGFTFYSLWDNRELLYTQRGRLILWVMLGAPLLTALISFGWHNVFLTRTLLSSGLLICILWANTLLYSPARNLARLVMFPLLLGTMLALYTPQAQRTDLRGVLGSCADSDYVFLTSTNLAISTRYYLDKPIYLWSGANDNNQWLNQEAKNTLGFIQIHSPKELRGSVCIPFQDNPITNDTQRKYLRDVLQAPHTLEVFANLTYYHLTVYRLHYE